MDNNKNFEVFIQGLRTSYYGASLKVLQVDPFSYTANEQIDLDVLNNDFLNLNTKLFYGLISINVYSEQEQDTFKIKAINYKGREEFNVWLQKYYFYYNNPAYLNQFVCTFNNLQLFEQGGCKYNINLFGYLVEYTI